MKNCSRVEIRTERPLINHCHGQNTQCMVNIIYPLLTNQVSENKKHTKNTFFPPTLAYHLPWSTTGQQGMRAVLSTKLRGFAAPPWSISAPRGSLLQDAVLPKLILCELPTGHISLNTAPTWLQFMQPNLQALLQHKAHGTRTGCCLSFSWEGIVF